MPLQADATINYILPDREVNQVNLTTEDTKIQSPYNTYLVEKLPIGPISSPGLEAMEAVLNPYEEYMNEDEPMLYYVLIDPEIGLHAFNSTYEAHIRDKNKYQANWE